MSSGLDLNQFLTNSSSGGGRGRGQWLDDWGKRNPPAITIWLHPAAKIYPVWEHQFVEVGEKKVEGTDRKQPCLRFPNYVGPDRPEVYESQRFRENGLLRVLPHLDPFIYLREWLRWCVEREVISKETVVFEWVDYARNNAPIQWKAGRLAGLVEKTNFDWSHTLDAKLSFLFTVVDADALTAGAKLTRETSLVGELTQKVMKQQMEAKGVEAGNPILNPYPIRWKYNPQEQVFGKKYDAFRFEQPGYEYTPEVYDVFNREFPEAEPYSKPGDGDLVKVRAAFEQAQQITMPLDLIFSLDLDTRRSVLRGAGAPAKGASHTQSTRVDSHAQGNAVRPPATPGAARPIPPPPGMRSVEKPASSPPVAPAPVASAGGRRRVAAPPPTPPPVEMLPCEKCSTQFPANAPKCPHCGQLYEVDAGSAATPVQATSAQPQHMDPVTSNDGAGDNYCAICGQQAGFSKVGTSDGPVEKCKNCGAEKSDDIPFRAEPRQFSSPLRMA